MSSCRTSSNPRAALLEYTMVEKSFNLAGKDFFTEPEAAHYCGVCLRHFQRALETLQAAGVEARRVMGKKLYARAQLARMIERSPTWHCEITPVFASPRSTSFPGSIDLSAAAGINLSGARKRPYKPRKKRSDT